MLINNQPGNHTMDILSYFSNPFALVPLVILIGGWIIGKVGAKDTLAQVITGVVALALSLAGHYLEIGFFGEQSTLWAGIYGVAAALSANGIASNDVISMFLEFLKLKVPAKK
jgi:hypothetical protein